MTPLSPRALSALFEEAQDLHQAGRLGEALERYKRILAADPRNGPALHMTGLLAFQNGQHQVAIDLMTQARQIGSPSAVLHSNLGLALRATGRTDEAVASFRRALGLKPDTAETHNNLGMALLEQGKVEAAVESFSRAAALNPTLAAAHANLGDALWAQGKLEQAEASHLRALEAGDSDVLKSLALLALAQGNADNALRRACEALARDDGPRTHRIFAEIVQSVRWQDDDPQLRHYLTRAVEEGWSRPNVFAANAFVLIKASLAAGGSLRADALLAGLLTRVAITDVLLERELTTARRQILLGGGEAGDFAAALAQQCFLNEYVWSEAADELAEVSRLRGQLDTLDEAQLTALACYVPLGAEPGAARLQAGSPTLGAILRRQRDEPAREKDLAATLSHLTPVKNTALEAVRARYDTAPYPRWVQLKEQVAPASFRAYLASRFPAAAADLKNLPDAPKVLVAGCGTGQYALETAREFMLGEMLAVDLSAASLAYAARKAEEAGAAGIRFAIADILELRTATFDVIECRGVLHHLPDPFAGLRALQDCLNPGGVLLAAFHSSRGRAAIAGLRDWVRQEGFPATDEGVRAARARLMQQEDFGDVLDALPFYTTSACRELFFEQDEKTHTLQEIAAVLEADTRLALVGIEVTEPVRAEYRRKFPDDPAAVNLANWALFEAEQPGTFASMYNLWLQKRAD